MFGARFDPDSTGTANAHPKTPIDDIIKRRKRTRDDRKIESKIQAQSIAGDNKVTDLISLDDSSDSEGSDSSDSDSPDSSDSEDSDNSDSKSSDSSDTENSDSSDTEGSDSSDTENSESSTASAPLKDLTAIESKDLDSSKKPNKLQDLYESDDLDVDMDHSRGPPPSHNSNDDAMEFDEELAPSKHQSILAKFKKSTSRTTNVQSSSSEDEEEPVDQHALAPLPQPELPRDRKNVVSNVVRSSLNWLAEPQFVPLNETCTFASLPLSPFMHKNVEKMGFDKAFAVQAAVLRIMLGDIEANTLQPDHKGDVLVNAATGLGKTLAYLIPIVEALHSRVVPRLRALILVPTRPLITQVMRTLTDVARGTSLNIVSLRTDISLNDEGDRLRRNVPDIVVSTPGRLVDHLNDGLLDVSSVRFLVIDEADRLLGQQFQNWVPELIPRLRAHDNIAEAWRVPVTKLIFSATLTTDAGRLAALQFSRPRLIVINDRPEMVRELFSVPPTLKEHRIVRGQKLLPEKPLILCKFLLARHMKLDVLIFCKSNEASLRLSRLLELLFERLAPQQKVKIEFLNSTNNKASVRARILREFASQTINIVIATDLIARGIDVASIKHVINYDLPNSAREYVHRVGRTARANQEGCAYTFCFGKGEAKWLAEITKEVGRAPEQTIDELEPIDDEKVSPEDSKIYDQCLEELQRQVYQRDSNKS